MKKYFTSFFVSSLKLKWRVIGQNKRSEKSLNWTASENRSGNQYLNIRNAKIPFQGPILKDRFEDHTL